MTRSRNLFGPYVDRNGRTAVGDNFSPLLNKSTTVYGPGHCSEFVDDDAGQTWVLYHGFMADNIDAGRVTFLDRIRWDAQGWPVIQSMRPSTEAEVPLFGDAAGIAQPTAEADDFSVLSTGRDGMFRIEGAADAPFRWQLLAASGQQMLSGHARQTAVVDASRLSRGVYVVRILGPRGQQCEKVLKH
jgi:arabinan endo-1,5-alpha-L-arabinosidase